MKKAVEYSFKFDVPKGRAPLDSLVKAVVVVKVNKSISFEYFDLEIGWAVRGLNKYSKNVVKKIRLDSASDWNEGEIIEYEFEFIPKGPISFKGKYMQILWSLETDIELSSESKKELRAEYISQFQIRRTFQPDFEYDQEKLFRVVADKPIYDCGHFVSTIKTGANPLYWIVPVALFLFSLVDVRRFAMLWLLSLLGSIIGGVIYFKNRGKIGKFDKVKFEIQDYDHDYKELSVHLGKLASKLETIDFFYDVVEEVTDNRGSSSQKYERRIIKSRTLNITDIQEISKVRFSLIADNIPGTLATTDSQIQWYLNFKFNFKNGTSDIRAEKFPVRLI